MAGGSKTQSEKPHICESLVAMCTRPISDSVIGDLIGNATVSTLPVVAKAFGVSPNTVKNSWRSGGMPGESGAWPLAEIFKWLIERERKQRTDDTSRCDWTAMQKEGDARKAMADARNKELSVLEREGQLIPVDEMRREASILLVKISDVILEIPEQLMPRFPAELAEELTEEVDRHARRALVFLADNLEGLCKDG